MGLSLLQCIQDALALLHGFWLSPFDLILEILDKNKPQYSYHRMEFYKDGNEKLERILNAILASNSGKRRLQMWIQQSATIDLLSNVITEEMNKVQKAELMPRIAAIA